MHKLQEKHSKLMDTLYYKNRTLRVYTFVPGIMLLRGEGISPLLLPSLGQFIQNIKPAGIIDVTATSSELCLYIKKGTVVKLQEILDQCQEQEYRPKNYTIPVYFDTKGDLSELSRSINITEKDFILALCNQPLTVSMFGFLAGFFYLTGIDKRLQFPRRSTPRPRVNKGAFAMGGAYVGIYPKTSPGGWHILGHVDDLYVNMMQENVFSIGDQIRIIDHG